MLTPLTPLLSKAHYSNFLTHLQHNREWSPFISGLHMVSIGLRKRSPRKKVRLSGRMRADYDWIDLSIRDISKKGLMAESADPPDRGHYIEIRRFEQILIGRVVWRNGNRFGVMLSDEIDFDAVIEGKANGTANDRRNYSTRPENCQARIIQSPDDWRWVGQVFERTSLTLGGAAIIATTAYYAFDAISKPMAAIGSALKP